MEVCGKAQSGGQGGRRPVENEGFQHLRESLLDCKSFGPVGSGFEGRGLQELALTL